MYVVMSEDGEMVVHRDQATIGRVREEITREGEKTPNTVYLDPESRMAGWVNDVSLITPALFGRNVVGSCVLVTMAAGQMAYAGPLVITGYNPRSTSGAPLDLTVGQVEILTNIHTAVRSVLAGEPPTSPNMPPGWAAAIVQFAEFVRDGGPPRMTSTGVSGR